MSSRALQIDHSRHPHQGGRTDPALLEALASREMYEGHPRVAVCETHASWVFLAGDRAYKIKKPVALGFLDYSTLALRRAACNEELRVNRELAPEIYLGVRAVVREASGFRFADEDTRGAVEYVVQMRRFAEAETIEGMIDRGTLAPAHVDAVAERLSRFHRSAPRVEGGGADQALEIWRVNLAELDAVGHGPRWPLDLVAAFAESFVRRHRPEIEQRVRDGYVRDCHGDLRCEHVLVGPEVLVVDRIEFDATLRHTDVAADLAFLAMDLEAHGQRWAARELVSAYDEAGGSSGSEALRAFYAAHRALVRAKVGLLVAAEHAQARAQRYARAERLWELAERLCWRARRPLAIVVCGPPASGKSTLAAELARRSELPVVSSDVVRKQLAGLPATARARPEHYGDAFTRATYGHLAEQAHAHLRADGGVIVDATCHSREQRALLLDRLTAHDSPCLTVHCQATPQVALQRAAERMRSRQRVSDATPEIVARQLRDFQPPSELPRRAVLNLDTESALDHQAWEVTRALDAFPAGST